MTQQAFDRMLIFLGILAVAILCYECMKIHSVYEEATPYRVDGETAVAVRDTTIKSDTTDTCRCWAEGEEGGESNYEEHDLMENNN